MSIVAMTGRVSVRKFKSVYAGCLFLGALLQHGCNTGRFKDAASPPRQETPMAITQGTNDASPTAKEWPALIARDSGKASQLLADALDWDTVDVAGYAAVYGERFALIEGQKKRYAVLVKCADSTDPLLAALCWRFLAGYSRGPLPSVSTDADVVSNLFAAVATARRHPEAPLPPALILYPPQGTTSTPTSWSPPPLLNVFDDGAMALAIHFSIERRTRRYVMTDGVRVDVARGLLERLLAFFDLEAPVSYGVGDHTEARPSRLARHFESSFVNMDAPSLHRTSIKGSPALATQALRALASVVTEPTLEDMAVVATAMTRPEPAVQIEAARTYLFLVKIAREGERP